MTTATVEAIALDATPGIHALVEELFSLLELPFCGTTITLPDFFLLFETCKARFKADTEKNNPISTKHAETSALVVTRMGIITHQIRLMLSQHNIKATCIGYTNQVPRLLKEKPFQLMVLDVPYERSIDANMVSTLPDELSYILKCQRALNTRPTTIAIMDPYDKRSKIIQSTGISTIVKANGWQNELKAMLPTSSLLP